MIVVVFENVGYDAVIGSAAAPYLNGLANGFALATAASAVAHPSLPNYLAMIAGDTFGVSSDCTTCYQDAPSLVDQLEARGLTWKGYQESLPAVGFLGPGSGLYAAKHDPFVYFKDVRDSSSRAERIVPFAQLERDSAAGKLPSFSFVTPNLCDDMHNCSVGTGDRWARDNLGRVLARMRKPDVMLLLQDEHSGDDSGAGGGHIFVIAAGPGAKPRFRDGAPYTTYSLTATVETLFGLPRLGRARSATPMTNLLLP